jgi:tRNA threonylcarbamoyladenosine modification (KEOPS) complex  Pcc1 subunit
LARVTCRLEFRYASAEVAEKILRAVEKENAPFVSARVEGETLISEAEARSIESLVRTLDDYLANLSVAEKVLEVAYGTQISTEGTSETHD